MPQKPEKYFNTGVNVPELPDQQSNTELPQRCGSATLPGLFLSLLQHRPHELLRSTGVEHKERLTQQRMLLAHRHKSKWTVRRKVEIMMPRLPLPVE